MKFNNILGAIGNTPHIRLSRMFPEHEVWIKLEKTNPGGSIKDRVALAMVEDAERKGLLKPGGTIVEPTSGNTGIGLALVSAIKGYKLILTMPESMSVERRKVMEVYGAEFVLTPKELGMQGAIQKASELVKTIDGAWIPQQFENKSNPKIHFDTTAMEIIKDFPDGLDMFISGVGTGGHVSGIGAALKRKFPDLKVFAVEPDSSAVISGEKTGQHAIQGIGAGFIPKNLNMSVLDGTVLVGKEEAYEFTRKLAKEEGLLAGISTGASLAGVEKKLKLASKKIKVLTINYDIGERYFTIEDLF